MSEKVVMQMRKFIRQKGMCQMADVMKKFDFCKPTVITYFRKVGVLTSFNSKGQYYILPEEHQFDDNGLLFIGQVGFFKGGSLLKAICHLVENSHAGMGARELDKMLKTTTHSQLPVLFRKGMLSRVKAVNRAGNAYYYFSAEPQKAECQKARYFNPVVEEVSKPEAEIIPEELPDVIEVLLTIINHPEFSAKSVAISLKRRGKAVSRDLIERVFAKYLPGKKNS